MMPALFFTLLILSIYPYLLFPLITYFLAKIGGKDWARSNTKKPISIIISVFNEEAVIREKIENTLELQYPSDLLEIIIVSDGSTDRTDQIVTSFKDPRIKLLSFSERKGKTACLNQVVPSAEGEILVFTDANSMFLAGTLLKFTENFGCEDIGLVTGWTKYRKPGGEKETVGLYALLEMLTKKAESRISSCVGADGAVFGLRKDLYRPLKDNDINDFVIPLNVIAQGKRVVLDPELYCIEQSCDNELKEFNRQVRITNRTLGAIGRNIEFLNPGTYGTFSFFLLSHKVIRLLSPFFVIGTAVIGLLLAAQSLFYAGVVIAQLLFFAIGVLGSFKLMNGRLPQLCSLFLLTLAAQFVGWIRWATGKSDTLWKPAR